MNASVGLDWMSRNTHAQPLWLVVPAALAGLLYYFDLRAPDRMIFGLPYMVVVLLAQGAAGSVAAAVAAAAAATFVVTAPLLTWAPAGVEPLWMVVLGRGIVVGAIGILVFFLRQRDEARETLRQHVGTLEDSTSRRSDELRLVNAQLHREIAERRRAELRSGYLASIVESSADAIIGQSLDGTIVSWNAGATRVYGHRRADVIGRPSTCLLPPEQEELFLDVLARVARGERADEVESVRLRSDGTMFDVSASFSPILDEKGSIIGVSTIERDITRRMHAEQALQSLNAELEEKVRQRTEQLESAVGELEAFSYSVSHDLRAPLRALNGFAESLAEDLGDRLQEREQEMLTRIQGAAGRMDKIIEDLLTLSRAGNDRIQKEVVSLSEVARSVIEELRAGSPGRDVEWVIGDGLLAWGDAGLLRLVVQNLLGNAFKYTALKEKARIEFGVEGRSPEAVTYFVKDDGVGFDPGQAANLFRPFSRLHGRQEFEGSGIGLATVERILRRHGGEVSADGTKDGGATFRFRLPVPRRSRGLLVEDPVAGDSARWPRDSAAALRT